MTAEPTTPTEPRTWQEVAKDRGISLRILGELIGRPHSTMLAYSCGKRTPPQEVLFRISRVLGETIQ
jgi:transcriptional regulator with XRE-family HTH domain